MKTKLLFILLLFYSLTEAQPLEMLVDTNKLWSTLWVSGWNPPPTPYFEYTVYTQFSGDIVIGGYHYKEVHGDFYGYIREDSTHKVFFYNPDFSPPDSGRLLYDFDVETGDTLEIFPQGGANPFTLTVTYMDSVLVCDQYRKRIVLDWGYDEWVEGIGSVIWGVMFPATGYVGVCNSFYCYIENDTIKNPESECVPCPDTCCYVNIVNINEAEPENINVTIIPNPVTSVSMLRINMRMPVDHYDLEIYSANGKLAGKHEINKDGPFLIHQSDYAGGLYFFRLVFADHNVITGKFLVVQ